MELNTILNIYQSYSLAKVSALNKQMLIAQYAENEQLVKLNKELQQANRATAEILRNQKKEVERQERCRYFKNLTFTLNQVVDKLSDISNNNFKVFASDLFLPAIVGMTKESQKELEEIQDKEYASTIIKKATELGDSVKILHPEYEKTPWVEVIPTKKEQDGFISSDIIGKKTSEIEEIKAKIDTEKKKEISNSKGIRGCFIFCLCFTLYVIGATIYSFATSDPNASGGLFWIVISALLTIGFGYAIKRNKKPQQKKNFTLELKQIDELEIFIEEQKAKEAQLRKKQEEILTSVSLDYPNWEKELDEIASCLPKINNN